MRVVELRNVRVIPRRDRLEGVSDDWLGWAALAVTFITAPHTAKSRASATRVQVVVALAALGLLALEAHRKKKDAAA